MLYFHADNYPLNFYGPAGPVVRSADPEFLVFSREWMNTVQPVAGEDAEVSLLGVDSAGESHWFELDTPMATDMFVDLSGDFVADLVLRSNHLARRVSVQLELFAGETHLGGGRATAEVQTTATPVSLSFAPVVREPLVPSAGAPLRLYLQVEDLGPTNIPAPIGFFPTGATRAVYLVTAASRLALPLLPVHQPNVGVSSGERLVALQLAEGMEASKHVNPGRWTAFPLVLTNLGLQAETIDLAFSEATPRGWSRGFAPAAKFYLESGEAANATFYVRPPLDAEEGARFDAEIVARVPRDVSVRSVVQLSAIVTKGIEIPDEAPVAPIVQ
ncbi:MAG: NEW3 domain-containing protein, partial [Vicinamibacterales bacterium]